ncbi:MAG: LD-carboxypeptidase [Fimbriimonadaceae bacterium]|nr:LD-carboxypeptidase [Fimbriimonadaceae bacterium]
MPEKIKPRALKPGSHVRVVTPASALTMEQIEDGIKFLEAEGYRVSLGDHVFDRKYYLAGGDETRASDFMAAVNDDDVDCVMCSRGGYGCARLMPYLDLDRIVNAGKQICGFSDVTTLHLALNKRGLVTLHTPMMITLSVERVDWVYDSFREILKGGNPFPASSKAAETLVSGTAEGEITGGCLCLMTDSFGTDYELDCRGKIVVIEDVDEDPHRVDAMLTNLINNGQLQQAAGIVVGEMTGTDERADPKIGTWPWREIVEDRIKPLGIPSVVNFPFGHMKTMLSLPMGVGARLDAAAGRLSLLESYTS